MKKIAYLHTPIGLMEITQEREKITSLTFVKFQKHAQDSSMILQEAKWQLEAYFEGKRKTFSLPIHLSGTPLQEAIYKALMATKYGETLSYKALGYLVSEKEIARAVGSAMAKNPLPIIVPCHRVLHNDGSLGDYSAAEGTKSKQWLIDHEKSF